MSSQRSACHHGDVSRILAPMGAVDSRVASLRRCGASCHGKGLAELAKAAPRQGSCRGVCSVPFALCGLGLGVVLLLFSFGLTLAYLPCRARCGGARGSDCPCTVIGVQKCTPPFLYTDRSPRVWATHKRNA